MGCSISQYGRTRSKERIPRCASVSSLTNVLGASRFVREPSCPWWLCVFLVQVHAADGGSVPAVSSVFLCVLRAKSSIGYNLHRETSAREDRTDHGRR